MSYSEHDLPAIGTRVVSGNSAGTVIDYGRTVYELCTDVVVIVDWDGGKQPTPIQPRYLSAGDIANCGHTYRPDGFSTGYARDSLNYTLCYACAAESDRQTLRDGSAIIAYVGQQAHAHGPYKLTTWAGEFLGYVGVTPRPAARKRYVAGTVAGLAVYGSGPIENGDYVTIRTRKVAK